VEITTEEPGERCKVKLRYAGGTLVKLEQETIKEGPGEMVSHIANFVDCIKTRKKPNADVEIGHRSNSVCHLVNICRDMQRKLQWDPKAEKFIGDREADKMLSRPRRKGYELPVV